MNYRSVLTCLFLLSLLTSCGGTVVTVTPGPHDTEAGCRVPDWMIEPGEIAEPRVGGELFWQVVELEARRFEQSCRQWFLRNAVVGYCSKGEQSVPRPPACPEVGS